MNNGVEDREHGGRQPEGSQLRNTRRTYSVYLVPMHKVWELHGLLFGPRISVLSIGQWEGDSHRNEIELYTGVRYAVWRAGLEVWECGIKTRERGGGMQSGIAQPPLRVTLCDEPYPSQRLVTSSRPKQDRSFGSITIASYQTCYPKQGTSVTHGNASTRFSPRMHDNAHACPFNANARTHHANAKFTVPIKSPRVNVRCNPLQFVWSFSPSSWNRAGDREHGGQDPELQQRAYSIYQRSFALDTGTQRAMLGTYGRYIRQKDVGLVLSGLAEERKTVFPRFTFSVGIPSLRCFSLESLYLKGGGGATQTALVEAPRDLARGAVRTHTTAGARESTQAPREVCRRAVHAYTIAGVRQSTLANINGRGIFAGYPPSRRIRLNLCHLEANHRQYTVRVFEIEARSAPRNSERDIERKEGF
ncbi:hypothetical protein IW261DRAFT_1599356 [Armillaria novae-zelandiae]|uniref:Uncharacterized protein n=1 Tax=Armillaria novae-zelandiae TaxID=153914 RepID=A0AA39N9I7_9AGAR|nr:hypothetical protein IW261DRAFT_1599356 [Armillaria novae-zelandiae]